MSMLGYEGSGVVEEPEAEAYLASLEASPTLSKEELSSARHSWQDIQDLREWNSTGLAKYPILDCLSSRRSDWRSGLKDLEQNFKQDIDHWNQKQAKLLAEEPFYNHAETTVQGLLQKRLKKRPSAARGDLELGAELQSLLWLYMLILQRQQKPEAASQWLLSSGLMSVQQRELVRVTAGVVKEANLDQWTLEQPPRAMLREASEMHVVTLQKAGDAARGAGKGAHARPQAWCRRFISLSLFSSSAISVMTAMLMGRDAARLSGEPAAQPAAGASDASARADTCANGGTPFNAAGHSEGNGNGSSSSWWERQSHDWNEWLGHIPEDCGFAPVKYSLCLAGGALLVYAVLAERSIMGRMARRVGKKLSDGFIVSTAA